MKQGDAVNCNLFYVCSIHLTANKLKYSVWNTTKGRTVVYRHFTTWLLPNLHHL